MRCGSRITARAGDYLNRALTLAAAIGDKRPQVVILDFSSAIRRESNRAVAIAAINAVEPLWTMHPAIARAEQSSRSRPDCEKPSAVYKHPFYRANFVVVNSAD